MQIIAHISANTQSIFGGFAPQALYLVVIHRTIIFHKLTYEDKMTKFLSRFCTLVATVLMSATAVAAASEPAKKIINIGIYAPFTSKSAYIGRNILGAMEIARGQLNAAEIDYEFYTLDILPAKANSANTLQKFVEAHHINVLLTEGVDTGTVVAPLAKKNSLIHFCLDCAAVADGKNTFQAQSPNHQRGALLTSAMKPEFVAQFKQEYFSQPVTEAGYAYDIFHLLNTSAVLAMKSNATFSSQAIASNLLALESGTGLLGSFRMNKQGLAYQKESLTA